MPGRLRAYVRQHHLALLALFVALGGTSYAAANLPRDSVGSRQLRSNAVSSSKVRDRSLKAKDFARGQIPRGPVGPRGPGGAAAVITRTRLNWSAPKSVSGAPNWTKVRDLAPSVTKKSSSSTLEITVTDDATTTGGAACSFQIRVDGHNDAGQAPTDASFGQGNTGGEAQVTSPTFTPFTLTGVFTALAAGPHTVSLWVANDFDNTNCVENSGGFGHSAFIEETAP